jgi:hypothetical protein
MKKGTRRGSGAASGIHREQEGARDEGTRRGRPSRFRNSDYAARTPGVRRTVGSQSAVDRGQQEEDNDLGACWVDQGQVGEGCYFKRDHVINNLDHYLWLWKFLKRDLFKKYFENIESS